MEGFNVTMEVWGVGFNERLGVKTGFSLGERRHLSQDVTDLFIMWARGCIWAERQLC